MLKHIDIKKINIVNTLPRTNLNRLPYNLPNELPNYPSFLRRTHKATCPLCHERSETFDPNNRIVICYFCNKRVCKL